MKFTIRDFRKRFPNDDACLDEVMRIHYGTLKACPDCKKPARFHRVRGRRCYECQWCAFQLYPTRGTPLEKTTTPLSSWFYVIYLMTATRSGVSAKEVERQLGVTYKCAWRMCHQIRLLMAKKSGKLSGHVEADETYSGGVRKGKRGRGAKGKTPVFGMAERQGRIRAEVVGDVKRKILLPLLEKHVEKGSRVSTDEFGGYVGIGRAGYDHGVVNHAAGRFVSGIDYTQSIEGFWARLKLSIRGTHVHVSGKHLQKYVDEFSFRYNNRTRPALMFHAALSGMQPSSEAR